MLDKVIEIVKGLVRREAARLIAYSSVVATTGLLFLATQLGVEFSAEFIAAVGIFAAALATETIRVLVFSEKTVEKIVEEVRDENAQEAA